MASTTTNTEAAATIDANDATCIGTATALSSNNATSQPAQFNYTHEEVQVLLDEASLRGWEEGVKEGLKMGKEKILENRQRMWEKGKNAGYRMGRKDGLKEGERLAGHGPGLCISKEAHTRELWRGAVLLDEAQVQTDPEMPTWSTQDRRDDSPNQHRTQMSTGSTTNGTARRQKPHLEEKRANDIPHHL
jgi:hypothetical protein